MVWWSLCTNLCKNNLGSLSCFNVCNFTTHLNMTAFTGTICNTHHEVWFSSSYPILKGLALPSNPSHDEPVSIACARAICIDLVALPPQNVPNISYFSFIYDIFMLFGNVPG